MPRATPSLDAPSTRTARARHQWVRRRLCPSDRDVPAGTGLALLWIDGDLVIPGRHGDIPLSAGDLVVADRVLLRSLRGSRDWSAQALYLEDRRILEHVGDRRSPTVMKFSRTDALADVMRQLRIVGDNLSQAELEDELIGAALIDLVTRVSIRMAANAMQAWVPSQQADTVERARALIRSRLADPRFGVAALALEMRLSPRHLSTLFAPFGTTTARAILEMRIERGCALLRDPVNVHRQVADVARACGFEDQNYFSRCFRAILGRSPREFRADQDFSAAIVATN